jgi:hypothetical protein
VIFEASANTGVIQDKQPPGRFSPGSPQPVTATGERETATDHSFTPPDPADNRHKHHGSEKRQLQLIAGRIAPHLKTQVLRRAKAKGWSESKTVADLVEQALARDLAEQFAITLKNAVQDAVTTQLRQELASIRNLAYQGFYSAEQGRIHGIQLLHLFLQGRTDVLSDLIDESQDEALANMKPYVKHADGGGEYPPWPSSSSHTSGAGRS